MFGQPDKQNPGEFASQPDFLSPSDGLKPVWSMYTQQELAMGDVVRAAISAVRQAYSDGISRRQPRE